MTLSWNDTKDIVVPADEPLFYFVLEGDKKLFSSDQITMSGRIAEAKLISQMQLFDLVLARGAKNYEQTTEIIFQNRPNPFDQQTIIYFELPEDMEIELLVSNSMGKTVLSIKEFRLKGMNELVLLAEKLGTPGMYQYSLKTKNGLITKKMIYLK